MPKHMLHLTAEEQEHVFARLPRELQERWKDRVHTETIDAYETEEELMERMRSVRYDDLPGVRTFMEASVRAAETGDLESVDFSVLPEAAFPRYFHSIGACGMSAMLQLTLQEPGITDEGMQAAASMSIVRHIILEANASAKAAA